MNDYIKNLEASQMKESVDEFNVGDTVKVHNRIKEGNKERIQIFEGTVVKRQGGSNRETFTVRKISSGCGHGVGMSQNGANELAKLGYTAAQIISHYYNGAVLSSVEK